MQEIDTIDENKNKLLSGIEIIKTKLSFVV